MKSCLCLIFGLCLWVGPAFAQSTPAPQKRLTLDDLAAIARAEEERLKNPQAASPAPAPATPAVQQEIVPTPGDAAPEEPKAVQEKPPEAAGATPPPAGQPSAPKTGSTPAKPLAPKITAKPMKSLKPDLPAAPEIFPPVAAPPAMPKVAAPVAPAVKDAAAPIAPSAPPPGTPAKNPQAEPQEYKPRIYDAITGKEIQSGEAEKPRGRQGAGEAAAPAQATPERRQRVFDAITGKEINPAKDKDGKAVQPPERPVFDAITGKRLEKKGAVGVSAGAQDREQKAYRPIVRDAITGEKIEQPARGAEQPKPSQKKTARDRMRERLNKDRD